MQATRSRTRICKPSFNSPYRSHCCDTSRPTLARINSNTSGKMSFLLFPFLFPPFFLSFAFFSCFIFHFCGTVMAWINTMTGCFRLSGFSRRYFHRTRELVNSLAAGTRFAVGGRERGRERGRGRRESKMHVLKARGNKPADSQVSSPPPLRHHPRSKTHPRFALFLSLPRSFVPLWCTSCRRWRDRSSSYTPMHLTYVHTRTGTTYAV